MEILTSPLNNKGPRSDISSWGLIAQGLLYLGNQTGRDILGKSRVGRVWGMNVSVCAQSHILLPFLPEQPGRPGSLGPS